MKQPLRKKMKDDLTRKNKRDRGFFFFLNDEMKQRSKENIEKFFRLLSNTTRKKLFRNQFLAIK